MNRSGFRGLTAILCGVAVCVGTALGFGKAAGPGAGSPGTPPASSGGKKASVRIELELKIDPALSGEAVTRALDRACTVLRVRLERYGQQSRVFRVPGSRNRVRVFLTAPVDLDSVRRLLTTRALLAFRFAYPDLSTPLTEAELRKRFKGKYPEGYEPVPFVGEGTAAEKRVVLAEVRPALTGEHLKEARADTPENAYGQPVILFTLDSAGATIFGDATSKNLGRGLAIVLDGRALSVPVIRERITSEGMISGMFTLREAQVLATALASGALPAEAVIVGEVD